MTLSARQRESYERDGCLRVEGVFSSVEIDSLRRLIYRLYRKFQPDDTSLDAREAPWNELAFDRAMIDLRKHDPKMFGALYDCAQNAIEVLRFVTHPRLLEIAADCLGETPGALSYSGVMLRMDPPRDTRNTIDWHQDRSYYPQNLDGNHGLVATVALQDIVPECGALVVCPGSQREGLVEPAVGEKADYETTEQRKVPEELVDRYEEQFAEARKGDVLLMNLNLFHRSGYNEQEYIRYSALCRFHRIMAPDYVPFGLLYNFNGFMEKRVAKKARDD